MKNKELVTFKLLAQRFWALGILVCGALWCMVCCSAWHFAFSVCLALCFVVFGILGPQVLGVLCSWHFNFLCLALLTLCLSVFCIFSALFLCAWCSWHSTFMCLVFLVLYFSMLGTLGILLSPLRELCFFRAWLCMEQQVAS